MVGLTLPLPIFNQNRAQVEIEQVSFSNLNTDITVFRNQISGQIEVQKKMIRTYESLFQNNLVQGKNNSDDLSQILSSFEEGWIDLSVMLNSVQIYHGFIQSYNEQLLNYYQAIFNLEALVGKRLIKL